MKKTEVISQGYVGLPLAIEFSQHFPVIGFDINEERVDELNSGQDRILEADLEKLNQGIKFSKATNFTKGYKVSRDLGEFATAQIYIVTVPIPIDKFNAPDLAPLIKASEMLGKVLKKGDIEIYESTVYPICTEEDCVPVLENFSGLKLNQDTTEQDLEDVLHSFKIDIRIVGDEYKDKDFTGRKYCQEKGIKLYFNTRDHRFSSSGLRKTVHELEKKNKYIRIETVKHGNKQK